ncbi:hypothetical protein [Paenibacillus puldeungensis]
MTETLGAPGLLCAQEPLVALRARSTCSAPAGAVTASAARVTAAACGAALSPAGIRLLSCRDVDCHYGGGYCCCVRSGAVPCGDALTVVRTG